VLQHYGHPGVPLYLVSVKGGEPKVLPQILTSSLVIQALSPG
jgi:thiol:disulfide interchange protein